MKDNRTNKLLISQYLYVFLSNIINIIFNLSSRHIVYRQLPFRSHFGNFCFEEDSYNSYISDTDTIIYFNIKGRNYIEEIYFEDVKFKLSNSEKVQTKGDPLRQKNHKHQMC